MRDDKIKPSDTYEGLLRQFCAMKSLLSSMENELKFYRNKDYSLSENRLRQLEEALDSEKEMNDILTRQTQYRPISEFDGRMFSIMSDGTPEGTDVFKYKGHVPERFIKWAALP